MLQVFRDILPNCRFVANFVYVTVYDTVCLALTRAFLFFYQELLFNSSYKNHFVAFKSELSTVYVHI